MLLGVFWSIKYKPTAEIIQNRTDRILDQKEKWFEFKLRTFDDATFSFVSSIYFSTIQKNTNLGKGFSENIRPKTKFHQIIL